MRPLSAPMILQLWEIGQHQHPVDRALTLLSFGDPDQTPDALACLSIGQRDRLLLSLRELTFGKSLDSMAACPQCSERLEFTLDAAALRGDPLAVSDTHLNLNLAEFEVQVSLPNSYDLAAIAHCADLESARALLVQRCLHQVKQSGVLLEDTILPPELISQIANHLSTVDPQAEIWLDLACPACQHTWQMLFDIVQFFWAELSAQAKRLMQEVYTLARFYGWREADILAMSSARRQAYLELAG